MDGWMAIYISHELRASEQACEQGWHGNGVFFMFYIPPIHSFILSFFKLFYYIDVLLLACVCPMMGWRPVG